MFEEKKISKKESRNLDFIEKIVIFLSFLTYLLLFPPFFKNQTLIGHDAGSHLNYLRIFTDALSQGQFPVRWIEWTNLGQNQPLFSFYQPLLYYLGEIPHFFGLNILNSLYITVLGLWLFSGFITYLFVKNITKSSLASLVSSLIYVFAPYHILDIFVRAAYPEVTALAFAPGLFWALERYFSTKKNHYLAFLALFFAGTFLAHPPTLMMFTFPFALYFSFLLWTDYKNKLKQTILIKKTFQVILSLILGFGLVSFFAIPAFLQQNLINSSTLNLGYLNYRNHFACFLQLLWSNWDFGTSTQGCMDQMSFQVGVINWIIILSSLAIILYHFSKKIKNRNDIFLLIWLAMAFFGMYMTLSVSQPFWEGVPYLSFLQFPWRFLSIVIFASAVLAGILFTYINNKIYKIVFYVLLVISIPLIVFNYLKPAAYLPNNYFSQDSSNYYQRLSSVQKSNTVELGYMPKYAQVLAQPEIIPASEIRVLDSKTTIKVITNTFTHKEYILNLEKPAKSLLYIHYFSGWEFKVNDIKVKPDYDNIYGFVYLNLGSGENRIIASFTNTVLVSFANLVSLLSLVILLIFLFTSFKWHLFFKKLTI